MSVMETVKDTSLVLGNGLLELTWPLIVLSNLLLTYPLLVVWRLLKGLFRRPLDMQDKVVLLTGASSGIGQQIAYEYAKLGARLALVARREEKLEGVTEECRKLGSKDVLTLMNDMGDEEGCRKAVEDTIEHFHKLDTLVLNAGLFQLFAFEEIEDVSKARSVMDVNFWGYVYTTKHALPHLRRSKGQIVVNDSVAAFLPQLKSTIYNASKAAVSQFFETLRLELGSDVPITVFLPGVIKSEMTDGKGVQPDGRLPHSYEQAVDRRNEGGFGLFPVYPTSALAHRAVKAARYRQQRVVIPSWYKVMFYLQIFQPELLQAQLWSVFSGRQSVIKSAAQTLGGGLKVPTQGDAKGWNTKKEE